MFGLKVPIIMVVTREGGLGGVLAIACSNKLFMLENSAFYIASPEACAAILWKSSQTAPKVAEKLRIMTQEHYRLKIADGIIPEPLGGAHADPAWTSQQIKTTITQAIKELEKMNTEELLQHRRLKFRLIGGYQEGIPMELKRKHNIKPSEVNMPKAADLEAEIENLKKKILEAKGPFHPVTIQTIEKLKQDVDKEMANAFISMGLLIEVEERKQKLKAEINQRIPTELKEKMELLKNAREKTSKGEATDKDLMEEKNVVTTHPELKEKIVKANAEIYEEIEKVVNEAGINGRIEELRADIAKVSSSSEERKKAEAKIKEDVLAALNVEALKAKVESLTVEVGLPNEIDAKGKISAENGKF
ncbi:hypothetical protein ACFX2A_000567 [Malus domestica]